MILFYLFLKITIKEMVGISSIMAGEDIYVKTLERAWGCVTDQFFNLACDTALNEGKGVSIFKFLKKSEEGSNCHYFFSKADGVMWNSIIETSPQGKYILDNYDHESMILICVQIPIGDTLGNDETSGNLKLFHIDTKKEFSPQIKKSDEKKPEGLRKRNVKVTE
jgi:hypothetical protein